ncbi:MAG: hypothetical protein ACFFCW_18105 [Candidatus Hodarchaeota archaeon]
MARKRRKNKVEDLIGQLIKSELEAQLSRMVRKARKKAIREAGKLNGMLRLEYRKDEGFVDAEVIDGFPEKEEEKKDDGSREQE